MKQCAECRWPAEIGSRCGDHWVSRHAKRHGLCNVKWFEDRRQTFIHMLLARYTAIVEGAPIPSIECFERLYAEARVESNLQKIRTIIIAADRAARRERVKIIGSTTRSPEAVAREIGQQGETG
jgi:hypothetical protein